ncbi:hypothetical protein SEPCBS57363_001316 [Sporothrix epigloea]|uniref:Endo-1,3(4)-beta-glucanase n=1 Tax=Sporothrix epigloea TaxID=1892477 RepID=A0ABP0D9K6_9PEZI
MANWQGQGGEGLGVDPNTVSTMHIKSIQEAAKLADYLPLRWDELPKIPFYGRFFGYNDQWYRASIAVSVFGIRSRAQRVLSQEETQVLANLSATMTKRMSYEFPVLIGTVFFLERHTRANFGFPFYTPGASFSPDCFPNAKSPMLKGAQARLAWHGLRFTFYTAASHFALKLAFIGWASSLNTIDFESNPKLADLRETLKRNRGKYEALEKKARQEIREKQLAGRSRPEPVVQTRSYSDNVKEDPVQNTSQIPHSQTQEQEQRWPQSQQQRQQQQQSQTQEEPQEQSYDDYSDSFADNQDDFDDASPIALSARRGESTKPTGGPGASWERLRHAGSPGQKPEAISRAPQGQYGWEALRSGQPPPQQSKLASSSPEGGQQTTGDYTFSSADEEKAYAQNQAQKKFDALLEKERKGETEPTRRW